MSRLKSNCVLFRGYYTAVFISTRISRSSVDYQSARGESRGLMTTETLI